MAQLDGLKFSKTHEWVRAEGEIATVGVSQHAVDELGDVALVLLPTVGRTFRTGESFGEIESLKAVSDLYAPVSGMVEAINTTLADAPEWLADSHSHERSF
jgi:glycine cleavage system H protein